MTILSHQELREATVYNTRYSTGLVIAPCVASLIYKPSSKEFAEAIAILQFNNKLFIDGKLGVNTRRVLSPKPGRVLNLSAIQKYAVDSEFIQQCQYKGIVGRIALLVCKYNKTNQSMSKHSTDFFGLDGGTLGWPHFAASSLNRYIKYIALNYPITVERLAGYRLALRLQQGKSILYTVKDRPHNGGSFSEPSFRQFCIKAVHDPSLVGAQGHVWYEHIFLTGKSYFDYIGLQSERGLAMCVRWRNSGSMGLYTRRRARSILRSKGERTTVEYLQRKYVEKSSRRQSRIVLMNHCFDFTSVGIIPDCWSLKG